ncbi:MAG: LamG-like jellyroll fold domain-containing protein, partial [Thermoguttaceae bacterium]
MKVISRISVFPLVSALFLGLASSARADLVAHWAFDEAAGATTAADSTGTYPATPSNTSITFGDAGKFGNAVTFDGTTASSQLTYSGLQGIYDTSVSFSFWVKVPETTNTGGQVIGAWQNSWGYRIYFSNDQRKISFDARSSSDGYAHYNTYGASTGNLVADQWNHVVVVLDRENNKTYTYLNGNFANGNTYPSMGPLWESTGVSGMGWKQDQAGGGLLNGSLDE